MVQYFAVANIRPSRLAFAYAIRKAAAVGCGSLWRRRQRRSFRPPGHAAEEKSGALSYSFYGRFCMDRRKGREVNKIGIDVASRKSPDRPLQLRTIRISAGKERRLSWLRLLTRSSATPDGGNRLLHFLACIAPTWLL